MGAVGGVGARRLTALMDEVDQYPVDRRALPPHLVELFQRPWAEREAFLDDLDAMPQTVCHFDFFHSNLFTRYTTEGREETVVIDSGLVGTGALGLDLMPLWGHGQSRVEPSRWEEYGDLVLEGYLQGLRDVGWLADAQQVQLARDIYIPLILLIYWVGQRASLFFAGELSPSLQQILGRSIEEDADDFATTWGADPVLEMVDAVRKRLGLA